MKTIQGYIFDGDWYVLIHCCNLYHVWGGGIVIPIKKRFPCAYEADLKTKKGDADKLGSFTVGFCEDRIIANLYAQIGIGNDGNPLNRNLRYDCLYDSLYRLCEFLGSRGPTIIGVPDLIGCGLAGGNRDIVIAILKDIERLFNHVSFHIFRK